MYELFTRVVGMNEEILKKIISVFIKKPASIINEETLIDNSAIQGSVLFHRMISRINDHFQIEIQQYSKIKTYEDILIIVEKEIENRSGNRN